MVTPAMRMRDAKNILRSSKNVNWEFCRLTPQ
jgi:hypothetical protein